MTAVAGGGKAKSVPGLRGVARAKRLLPLAEGIQLSFSGDGFHSGDYWTIPARPAAARVDWPAPTPPEGIMHHLRPLVLISWSSEGRRPTV